jgi:hypothetical protein
MKSDSIRQSRSERHVCGLKAERLDVSGLGTDLDEAFLRAKDYPGCGAVWLAGN